MNKILLPLYLFIYFSHVQLSIAQNIVPNCSFEDTVACPDNATTIAYSNGWSSFSNTPDYFNLCATNSNYLIPINGWGKQDAASCYAYAGFWAYYYPFSPNGREYLGRQMSTAMTIGQRYYASIKVSLADGSNCGINKIGILFLTSSNKPIYVNNSPHLYVSSIISDTLNWITISGSFVADSAYQYIILGNFFDDNNTDTTILGPENAFGYTAYYFIDDICVSIDSTICNPFTTICNTGFTENEHSNLVNFYPNPGNEKINIEMLFNDGELKVYNYLGTLINSQKLVKGKNIFDSVYLSKGIYLFSIKSHYGNFYKKILLTN